MIDSKRLAIVKIMLSSACVLILLGVLYKSQQLDQGKCYEVEHFEYKNKYLTRVTFIDKLDRSIRVNVLDVTNQDAFYSSISIEDETSFKETSCDEFSRLYQSFLYYETINLSHYGFIPTRDWYSLNGKNND